MEFKYTLDKRPGKKKLICPSCGVKQKFTPYIDTESEVFLDVNCCGICDRINNCGYHLTPKEYFLKHPQLNNQFDIGNFPRPKLRTEEKISYHDMELVTKSIIKLTETNLYQSYLNYYDKETVNHTMKQYKVGYSKLWKGANIFWQIDSNNQVRGGKIMLINKNTHSRVKYPFPHINWVHSCLKNNGMLQSYNLKQCLFGEHLIDLFPEKNIALVESEKTALTAAMQYPNLVWVATGSFNLLKQDILKVCNNRKVLVFPDLGCYDKWKLEVVKIENSLNIKVEMMEILELMATEKDKQNGFDIEDYILKDLKSIKGVE